MRRTVVAAVAAAGLAVVVPAAAAPGPLPLGQSGPPGVEELQRLRDQLTAANGDLDDLDTALSAATAELDEIEDRLAGASADLHEVEEDLATAEDERDRAVRDAEAATTDLVAANAELDRARDQWAERDAALASRVRSMWKGGGTDPGALMLEGLTTARDLHEISLTVRTVDQLIASDRGLVEEAVGASRKQAAQRARVAAAQQRAQRLQAVATAKRDRAASLVARQRALVTTVDAERDAKATVLAAIEADRLATTRVVQQLEERVAELAASLATAMVTIDPDAVFDGPPPAWTGGLPPHGRPLAPAIAGAAASAGVDARLFAALVWSESNFRPTALSHAGAMGLSQLMPATAAGLGVDAWDPVQNLVGGARFLRGQLERFGSAELALAAYNAGPGRVEQAGRRVPDITETQLYVLRVLERYESLVAYGA